MQRIDKKPVHLLKRIRQAGDKDHGAEEQPVSPQREEPVQKPIRHAPPPHDLHCRWRAMGRLKGERERASLQQKPPRIGEKRHPPKLPVRGTCDQLQGRASLQPAQEHRRDDPEERKPPCPHRPHRTTESLP